MFPPSPEVPFRAITVRNGREGELEGYWKGARAITARNGVEMRVVARRAIMVRNGRGWGE